MIITHPSTLGVQITGKFTSGNSDGIAMPHRYWIKDTYEARHAESKEPESIDKEFLRLWFRERCDPYADKVTHAAKLQQVKDFADHHFFSLLTPICCCWQDLPEAPLELVAELSRRYIYLYEQITGEQFEPVSSAEDPQERMAAAIKAALHDMRS